MARASAAVDVLTDPQPVLSFHGMTKRFGGTVAVDNLDLDLFPGEILALLGENGAGKSTLIKMLAGVYAPDAGQMRRNGQPGEPGKDSSIVFIHQDLERKRFYCGDAYEFFTTRP